jgi:transcriptional regulator with XRE-family HTH domain
LKATSQKKRSRSPETSVPSPSVAFKCPDGETPISPNVLTYVKAMSRNDAHAVLLDVFKASGLSQATLARRLGRRPEIVNRWLGAPGNLTIDSLAELLFAIGGKCVKYSPEDVLNGCVRNQSEPAWLGLSPERENRPIPVHDMIVSGPSSNPLGGLSYEGKNQHRSTTTSESVKIDYSNYFSSHIFRS